MAELASTYPVSLSARYRAAQARWSTRLPRVLLVVFVVIVGFMVMYPLVMLLLGSIAPPRGVTNVRFSLDGYRTALFDADARQAIVTTLWLSIVRATLAVSVAVFLSWAITRTNVPGRRLFHNLLILSFFLPLLPQLVAWSLLLSPKSGIINLALRNWLGLATDAGPLNIYSFGGIIFLGAMGWAGFLYLLICPAFQAMDAGLEESARTAGATNLQMIRRVTVPLLLPAILGAFSLAFVRMVESFETELILGTPAHIYVFTTQIYYYIHEQQLPNYPAAIALSTVLVVLTTVVIAAQARLLGRRSYVTVSGKSYRRTPLDLGPWKYLVLAGIGLYFAIHLALPLIMLVLGSLQRTTVSLRPEAFTLDHWKILADPDVWQTLKNTLAVGLVSATAGTLLAALISYIVIRTKFGLRRLLDGFTWVPYMLPSFVLSVGFLWAVLKGIPLPFTLYGTLGLLMLAFVVRLMPVGARLMNGTMVQLSVELEEAARVSGSTWAQSFRRVVLPLLRPALTVGWLIFMITVLRDLSTVILLYGARSKVLAITFYSYWTSGAVENAAVIGLFMTIVGLAMAAGIRLLPRSVAGDSSYRTAF